MKKAFILIAGLLLTACGEGKVEETTFALGYAYARDGASVGPRCEYGSGGGVSERLDRKTNSDGDPEPPNLWFQAEIVGAAEESAFDAQVYIARGYEPDPSGGFGPLVEKVLAEWHVDEASWKAGKKESLHVDFEGVGYDIIVAGVSKENGCSLDEIGPPTER